MEDMCAELLLDESFWKQLCPWMHVQGESGVPSAPVELEEEVVADMRNTLIDQGFLSVGPKQLWTTSHRQWAAGSSGLKGLAKAVLRLVEIGLPPSCLLVYDEVAKTKINENFTNMPRVPPWRRHGSCSTLSRRCSRASPEATSCSGTSTRSAYSAATRPRARTTCARAGRRIGTGASVALHGGDVPCSAVQYTLVDSQHSACCRRPG